MIQRIQSLFYLGAIVLNALIFFQPFAQLTGDLLIFDLTVYGIQNLMPKGADISVVEPLTLMVSIVLSSAILITSVLALYASLSFKNLKKQLSITKIAMFLEMLVVGGLFFYIDRMESLLMAVMQFGVGIWFPLASLVCLFLAHHFVKKDKKLLRSADRIIY